MPPGQLGRAFRNFHAARYHAAKRRIKNQALAWLGHLQHLAQGVEQMAIRNPALQPVGGPGLDDLARLAYAIAGGVENIEVAALQPLGDGLPAQAWQPEGPAVQHGYIDPTAFDPADLVGRAPGQQHQRRESAAGLLNCGHAGY